MNQIHIQFADFKMRILIFKANENTEHYRNFDFSQEIHYFVWVHF